MTDAERYAAARDWFNRLASLPPIGQAEGLSTIADTALRDQVRALLCADVDPRQVERLDQPPPERIGAFRVVRELGRGGMGVVYEAEEAAPRRRVALKLLHPWLRSPALDALARREAQALADTPHPGIPSVYALFDDELGPVVIMELVEGEPFAEALAGASRRERLEQLARVADAVAYAHARGVLHRDLKPQNLILASTGQPKVLDFGLADTRGSAAPPGGGTPAYMAPEQAAGAPPGPAADQHSLGVLAWEILSGVLPDQPGGRPLRADDAAVLRRAAHPDPNRRYADVLTFAGELRRLAEDRPVLARPGWLPWLAALARRRPRVLLGVALVATLLVASPAIPRLLAEGQATWRLARLREEAAAGSVDIDSRLDRLLRDPAFISSPAAVEGWLWRAERTATPAARLEALAAAWVYDPEPPPQRVSALAAALRAADYDEAADGVDGAHQSDPLQRWDFDGAGRASGGGLAPVFAALANVEAVPAALGPAPLDPDGLWRQDGARLDGPDDRTWTLPGAPADVALLRGPGGRSSPIVALRHDEAGLYTVGAAAEPWTAGARHQGLPARRLEAADLDGDGIDELVVAATGWWAHELRVYRADASLLTRMRFAPWDVAVTRDRTVWVLGGPRPTGSAPHGERRSLIPLKLVDGELEAGETLSLDRTTLGLLAADLDGDGTDELVLQRNDSFGLWAGGRVAWVPGLFVVRRLQADEDPAIELEVSDRRRGWILGMGSGALPGREAATWTPASVPPELDSRRLAGPWSRAAALAQLGAWEPVLGRVYDLARASRRSVPLRGAILRAVIPTDPTARAGLAAWATALLALDPRVPPDDATRALLREVHAFDEGEPLAPSSPADRLAFTSPLPAWLAMGRAGTVHRDPMAGVLALDAARGDGVLLRAVVRPESDTLCADLRLALSEVDWSAGLVVALGDGRAEATATLARTGGGPRAGHHLMVGGPGRRTASAVPFALGEHQVSLCVSANPALASARLDRERRRLSADAVPALTGPLTLELRAADGPGGAVRLRANVSELRLRGGRFDRDAAGGEDGARRFAETGQGAADARGLAVEAAQAGAADSVDLAALSDADVVWLLRQDAARWAEPAARALGARFPTRFAEAWSIAAHYRDPWAAAALRLPALRGMATDTPELERLALRRAEVLLEARDLAEAQAMLDALPPYAAEVAVTRARLAVRSGERAAVADILRTALAASPAAEAVRDAFADDPELEALVGGIPPAATLVP